MSVKSVNQIVHKSTILLSNFLYSIIPIYSQNFNSTISSTIYWLLKIYLISLIFALLNTIKSGHAQKYQILKNITCYINPFLLGIYSLVISNSTILYCVQLILLWQTIILIADSYKGTLYLAITNILILLIDNTYFNTANLLENFILPFLIQIATYNYFILQNQKENTEQQTEKNENKFSIENFENIDLVYRKLMRQSSTTPAFPEDIHAQICENKEQNEIYSQFFHSIQHPAYIVDLNVNTNAAAPTIMNSAGRNLIRSYVELFENAHLETSNCSLSEILSTFRRRVEHPELKIDRAKIPPGKSLISNADSEAVYDVTISAFDTSNGLRKGGILMIEMPKDREKEKQILEHFKTSLVCSLSHELFSPINSLIMALDLLPTSSPEQKPDYKTMAIANSQLLFNKISDLIDYTKIELNDFKLNESEFCVETLFDELELILKYGGLQKNNKLIFKTITSANRKLMIHADKLRIKQVLVKLITNANKYTENGELLVTAAEKSNNLDVIFSVKDTGQGMAKEKLDQILSSLTEKAKFLHEHNDGSTKLPGLGLEIARRICECMRGVLKADSTQSKGSTFSFTIPVCRIYTTPIIVHPDLIAKQRKAIDEKKELEEHIPDLVSITKKARSTQNNEIKILSRQLTKNEVMSKRWQTTTNNKKKIKRRGSGSGYSRGLSDDNIRSGVNRFNILPQNSFKVVEEVPENDDTQHRQSENVESKNEMSEIAEAGTENHETIDLGAKIQKYSSSNSPGRRTVYERLGTDPVPPKVSNPAISLKPVQEETVNKKDSEPKEQKRGVILITDDEPFNRMALKGMISKMHIKTLEAINGQDAVNIVTQSMQLGSPNVVLLVLMDLNMPVMDGIQACREIRKLEKENHRVYKIPIVAVSAHTAEQDRMLCRKVGMNEFVAKPIQAKDIERIMQTYANTEAEL